MLETPAVGIMGTMDKSEQSNTSKEVGSKVRVGIGAFVGMAVSVAPILIAPFPVLLEPVSRSFGWGRSPMSLAILLATSTATALYPFVGRALDRWGSRAVLVPGFFLFGMAIAALSLSDGSKAEFYALYMIAGALSTLPTGVAIGRILSKTFEARRGMAFGICLGIGGGIGLAITPIVTHWLIEAYGWRAAYLGLGLGPILIGFPVAVFLLGESTARVATNESPSFGDNVADAIRSKDYLVILFGIFILNLVVGGLFGHFVAMGGDAGVSPGRAAAMIGAASMATMVAQLFIGIALDIVKTPRLVLLAFGLILLGAVMIHSISSAGGLFAGIVLVGLGAGSEYGLLPYFLTRYFGLKSFGQLYGLVYAASAVSYGVGPVIMGLAFDRMHSYAVAMWLFEAAVGVALVMMASLSNYKYTTDGRSVETQGAELT
jgi:MFS family permease